MHEGWTAALVRQVWKAPYLLLGVLVLVLFAQNTRAQDAPPETPPTAEEAPPLLPIPWRPVREILDGMVRIPAGVFTWGSDAGPAEEAPARSVQLPTYYIDRTEVTRAAYAECVSAGACAPATPYPGLNDPTLPVTGVNWNQARDYCLWRGKRLPTEAEWEKAARGQSGWAFPWGESFDPKKANAADGTAFAERGGIDGFKELAPAESFTDGASSYGVINLSGNAAEWVLDWYAGNYYKRAPRREPRGPSRGRLKVVRGGSYNDAQGESNGALRATARQGLDPHTARAFIGFRCAWVADSDLTLVGDPENE